MYLPGCTPIPLNIVRGAHGTVAIPAVLPNTGTTIIPLVAEDQYKMKLKSLITNMAPPPNEGYSSILCVTVTRLTTGDTWGTEEIALAYMDAHVAVDRYGSYMEYTD